MKGGPANQRHNSFIFSASFSLASRLAYCFNQSRYSTGESSNAATAI